MNHQKTHFLQIDNSLIKEPLPVDQQEQRNGVDQQELLDLVIDSIQDIKGKSITQLDLRKLEEAPTDHFIICEGESTTQVKAIADNICKRIKEAYNLYPNHVEGKESSKWILVDFFDIVIHVFYPPIRQYYDLDDLWHDAKKTIHEEL